MEIQIAELLKVIAIGVIEGITEWLPISSTGHMLLFDTFVTLRMDETFKEMFFVVIQLGAILAVVVLFWNKMWPVARDRRLKLRMDILKTWGKVIVACIPSAVLGLLLDDFLEAHFGSAVTIAAMLILYGIAFILVERRNASKVPRVRTLEAIDWQTAFAIGLFQVLSMIPGTSRSGATIVGALLLGVGRTAAAEFTFFLAVPTMLGASALKLVKFGLEFTGQQLFVLVAGCIVAFGVSLMAIRFLMAYVQKHDFRVFGWYRIILGAVVLTLCVFH